MPLLQRWLALHLGAPDADVRVGFYFFDTATYGSRTFTPDEIQAAFEEARRLLGAAATSSP